MRYRHILIGIAAAVYLAGCALPQHGLREQEFVPEQELDVVSLVRQGLAAYQRSRYVDAEFAFRRALYLHPGAANVKANLAAALRASGQFDEAEDILMALNAAAPESLDYLGGLARLYVDKQDFASAGRYYTRAFDVALKRRELEAAARFARNLSALAFRIGDEAGALCHSQIAIGLKADPESALRHARLLLGTNRAEPARQYLTGYLSQPSIGQPPALVAALSMAELALGNNQRALELAQSAQSDSALPRESANQLVKVISIAKRLLGQSDESSGSIDSLERDATTAPPSAEREIETARASLYWPSQVLSRLES